VVNAYLVTFGSLLLLAGRIGDLIGRRMVLLAGLMLFTAASLACGLAPTASVLVAARFGQGAGAALASSVALGMIIAPVRRSGQPRPGHRDLCLHGVGRRVRWVVPRRCRH